MNGDTASLALQPHEMAELCERLVTDKARGAMVVGSYARGVARAASDLDLLVVAADDGPSSFRRQLCGHRLVETISKSLPTWQAHLAHQRPRWVWAFTDGGEVLFDDGAVHGLIQEATARLDSFVTSDEVKAELATNLWHAQAKLERAVFSEDPQTAACAAAHAVPDVLDALLALHDRPCVPGSRRMDVISTLSLDKDDRGLLDQLLLADPVSRAGAAVALNRSLRARLGPPDLERTVW